MVTLKRSSNRVNRENFNGERSFPPANLLPRFLIMFSTVICFVFLITSPALAAEWKGKEINKDGVLHMMNPAESMEQLKQVELKELWRIGGDTDDEDEFFGVISQILTDQKGDIYLLDSQLNQVKIFSQNGEYIRDIGREGEGPGEFQRPVGMFFTENGDLGVIQVAPGKIVLLTPEGEPAGEYPLPTPADGGFLIVLGGQNRGGNIVLAMRKDAYSEGLFSTNQYLASVDAEGNETIRYHEETRSIDFANPVFDESIWDTFDRRWTVGWDGRVYAVTKYPGYNINVWKKDGTIDRIIEVQHEPRKRTEEETELVKNIYSLFTRRIPNGDIRINEHAKDIENLFVREDGSLWVISSEGSRDMPDGSLGIFDVFNADGHFIRKVTLMGEGNPMTDGYYFVGDRLYVVTDLLQAALTLQAGGAPFQIGDEEPEPMAVICYELNKELRISRR